MANHHETIEMARKTISTVFVLEGNESLLLSVSVDRCQFSVHLETEDAQRLAWAILRGAEFVNKHRQAVAICDHPLEAANV